MCRCLCVGVCVCMCVCIYIYIINELKNEDSDKPNCLII